MPAKPSARQLSYLRQLAAERGMTFTYPQTSAQASREINRLKRHPRDSYTDRHRERKQIADAIQAGPQNTAARVRDDEVDGYGSSARWAHNRDQDPPAPQDPRPANAPRRPVLGERTELGTYTAGRQRRMIVGQRVDGVVRVCDVPDGQGRSYLIERELESNAELQALLADYLAQAERLGAIPMSTAIVEVPA